MVRICHECCLGGCERSANRRSPRPDTGRSTGAPSASAVAVLSVKEPRLCFVPLDRRQGVAVEDQRQGWRLRHRVSDAAGALACDLCAAAGCQARGGRPSALQAWPPADGGHPQRRGAGQRRAAAAVGLPPVRQSCRTATARGPATPASGGGMPRRSARPVAASLRTEHRPRPSGLAPKAPLKP
jgi:hypothetical protein